jgi:hypothetical protein
VKKTIRLSLVAVALALLGGGIYTATRYGSALGLHSPSKAAAEAAPGAMGFVDQIHDDGETIRVAGWALARSKITEASLVLNGEAAIPLRVAIPRVDVAQAHPNHPEAAHAGFEGVVTAAQRPPGSVHLALVVKDSAGQATTLLRRTLPPPSFRDTWREMAGPGDVAREDVFYFLMATSNLAGGDAEGIDTAFRNYASDTVKAGMRVQILYMRTTKGPAADYAFDPDFSPTHKCGGRAIAEDNLNSVIRYAVERKLPVLFTLNGGIWADAACDAPQWDLNDVLEQDKANLQWNEKNEVMPDDHLKNKPGSMDSPELGRALTFNFHAEKNHRFKKRNLLQAAALIHAFARQHPDLFVGINVDPDLYMNPFFEGKQWYDYNPGTVRQFREWLRGSGPYAAGPLAGHQRTTPLSLEEMNALSGKKFKSWDEVDPPREFPTIFRSFWKNPWNREWEHFRRHLVRMHYDQISQWLAEAGFARPFIYSAQGFMEPAAPIDPFPVRVLSPAKNYDTGGMSVEGAIPAEGHLGAILYGASAINQIRMEGEASLFATFRQLDPAWAVVEYNTASLLEPGRMAGFPAAYQSLRDVHNYGARFISPMAWNGSPGTASGKPGFVSYTALRETPLQEAIKDFMVSHANLPRRARLWTFGTAGHASDDGWKALAGTTLKASAGRLTVQVDADASGAIESPGELQFSPRDYRALVVQTDAPADATRVGVQAQAADGQWVVLVAPMLLSETRQTRAGYVLALPPADAEFQRLRITWVPGQRGASFGIRHLALYPR